MRSTETTLVTTPILAAFSNETLIGPARVVLSTVLPSGWSLDTIEHDDGTLSLVAMSAVASVAYRISASATGLLLEELGADDELVLLGASTTAAPLALLMSTLIQRHVSRTRGSTQLHDGSKWPLVVADRLG
jgi:hypothetical protein